MRGNKIKSITLVTNPIEASRYYAIGNKIRNSVGEVCGAVKRIEDDTLEFPDSVHVQFSIYDSTDKEVARIINCPVEVEYF